ncbi:MAG: Na(+)-translocating NADH-quinone reductase subunit C [Methylohalobius crimeensis]
MFRQILKMFAVVVGVSLVCSLMVTSAAVLLAERQAHNARANQIDHLMDVAGVSGIGEDALELYRSHVEAMLVDLDAGRPVDPDEVGITELVSYDIPIMAHHPRYGEPIPADRDIAGIKRRPRYMPVYIVRRKEGSERLILPIYGRGLWSTLYGYLALEQDLTTIAGITFYQHQETPGLGGQVDNPAWKTQWQGKQAYDERGRLAIQVIKGTVDEGGPRAEYRVDGLSGATLTTRGVNDLVRYWLGPHGYRPFLEWLRPRMKTES